MSNKSLLVLSIVTLVIIVAAVISSQDRAPRTAIETTELFPGLAGRVNDVSRIAIESQGGDVHILKGGTEWLVEEADNYPARYDRVKKLVLDMAALEVLSRKTSNPRFYPELGVEDPASAGAASRQVTLTDPTGTELAAIILGNPRPGEGGGQYVRKPDSDQAVLAGTALDAPADPGEWIVTDLLDIAADRVMEVTIRHPDGETVVLTRPRGEQNFQVADAPEGQESRSQYFTNQPAGFLSDLDIVSVKAADGFQFPGSAVNTVIRTYDGLVASMTAAKIDDENHVTLDFSVDQSLLEDGGETEEIVIGEQPQTQDMREEAAELNTRVSGWVFIIPQPKYLLLIKRPEELLKDREAPEGDTAG